MNIVYVNAGSFNDYGGWVLDTQFVLNMGSEYLLAHGLGTPVRDAKTTVKFPQPGKYKLWVYTKNWVADWKEDCAPGVFKVSTDGVLCPVIFGNHGKGWNWQDGGITEITSTSVPVVVSDMMGCEGRFAALLFTDDFDYVPPNDIASLEKLRRELTGNEENKQLGSYDFLVAGGGISGMSAAVTAARSGLNTVLIHDRAFVGGNNSSEVRVMLEGETNFAPYPKIGTVTREFDQSNVNWHVRMNTDETFEDANKMAVVQAEPNLTLLTGHFVIDAVKVDNKIESVVVYNVKTGEYGQIKAKLFSDCTGDASIGHFVGADYEMTTNGHMGMSNMWHLGETDSPQKFPRCPWAIDLHNIVFPGRENVTDHYGNDGEGSLGTWFWESGIEHDPIEYAEYARDTNFRAMYGAVDVLKNTENNYPNHVLKWAAYIGGKRESRRLLGDVLLTKAEVFSAYKYPDGIVPSTWNLDLHYQNRAYYTAFHEGDCFLTFDYHEKFPTPFWIPYRCLYSRNIDNLFMAGRNISVTHEALGTARVMRTGGMMGETVGAAAKICIDNDVMPRDVYAHYLDELLSIFR